jgi:hypothetical protein
MWLITAVQVLGIDDHVNHYLRALIRRSTVGVSLGQPQTLIGWCAGCA